MTETTSGFSRRTLVKGAAWSVPVLAVAAATPMAAASVGNATVSLPNSGALLDLRLFDAPTAISATLLPIGPDALRIQNGIGSIAGPVNVTFVVSSESLLSVSLGGRPHGIGVRELAGATRTGWTETEPSGDVLVLRRPWSVTSTFTIPGAINSLQDLLSGITYNYSQGGAFLGLGIAATFNVTATVSQADVTFGSASGSFTAPLNLTVG